MGDQTIYNALRSGGLSRTGACAMMGNMFCESGLKSTNVEDRCPIGDSDYTYNVDRGIIPAQTFIPDRYGYGLCQWTSPERKAALLQTSIDKCCSIGNEKMQCEFCIHELKKDYPSLYKYLCETDDLPKATERICSEFEKPAVNNFAARINAAQGYYNRLAVGDSVDPPPDQVEPVTITVRVLKRGDLGRDVFLLQCGLTDMKFNCGVPDGDFGKNTEAAVQDLQKANGLDPDGTAGQKEWQIIMG